MTPLISPLISDELLQSFGTNKHQAISAYRFFVNEGIQQKDPKEGTRHQLILGDESFTEHYREKISQKELTDIPRVHRKSGALPLKDYESNIPNKHVAMTKAYATGAYTMSEIGKCFGVHYTTVSRAIKENQEKT